VYDEAIGAKKNLKIKIFFWYAYEIILREYFIEIETILDIFKMHYHNQIKIYKYYFLINCSHTNLFVHTIWKKMEVTTLALPLPTPNMKSLLFSKRDIHEHKPPSKIHLGNFLVCFIVFQLTQ